MGLTPEQQSVVDHDPRHHARVLAGPGTGKSFTSVSYLERLASETDLKTQMLTFTRAATAEFAEKMGDAGLEGLGIRPPATVHSFALSLLMRTEGVELPKPLRIPDSWEERNLVRPHLSVLLRAAGHRSATPGVVEDLEREMSAGWESLEPDRILVSEKFPELGAAYKGKWDEHRWRFAYVIKGELPYRAAVALQDLGFEAVDLDVLLVDEYQDLNRADIVMIRSIADAGVTVIAIGDDDQSIYRFRMAAPEGIRTFTEDFNTKFDYPLTLSRRCGSAILGAASTLIASAPDRAAKPPLKTEPGSSPGQYAYLRFDDGDAELDGASRAVATRIAAGVQPSDIAILVRSNAGTWASLLRARFEERGIGIASTDWVEDTLSEDEVRRGIALGYLARPETREDSLSWWGLLHLTQDVGIGFINYVYERVGPNESFGHAMLRPYELGFPEGRNPAARRASETVANTLAILRELDIEQALLDDRGWGGWLLDRLDRFKLSDDAVRLFESVGGELGKRSKRGELPGIREFLASLEPLGKDIAAAESEAVRVITISRSKGLTMNPVIVLGVERGIIPMEPPKGELNEERRLLYVAMTRATDMCLLTWAHQRRGQTAHMGRPIFGARSRCPLLENLPGGVGNWIDGERFVRQLEAAV